MARTLSLAHVVRFVRQEHKLAISTPRSIASSVRSTTPKAPNLYTELSKMVTGSGLMRRRYGYYWMKLIAAPMAVAGMLVVFVLLGDTLVAAGHRRRPRRPAHTGRDART